MNDATERPAAATRLTVFDSLLNARRRIASFLGPDAAVAAAPLRQSSGLRAVAAR